MSAKRDPVIKSLLSMKVIVSVEKHLESFLKNENVTPMKGFCLQHAWKRLMLDHVSDIRFKDETTPLQILWKIAVQL